MTHQSHKIPWQILSSHLKPIFPPPPSLEPSNLFARDKPNQAQQLDYFIQAFARNIHDHAGSERAKYGSPASAPDYNEIVIGDEVALRIKPTVLRLRRRYRESCDTVGPRSESNFYGEKYTPPPNAPALCDHYNSEGLTCGCVLPYVHRQARVFLHYYTYDRVVDMYSINPDMHFNMEIVKTLILYGEMGPILRICAHPDSDIPSWHTLDVTYMMTTFSDCGIGWDRIYLAALDAYLSLNICYCFPELWDAASGRTPERDYRNLRVYQNMLRFATGFGDTSEIARFPHREFFGILDDQLDLRYEHHRRLRQQVVGFTKEGAPTGTVPFPTFLTRELRTSDGGGLLLSPSSRATGFVARMLRIKGRLPPELALLILDFADYKPRGKLSARPDNPLHVDNAGEVRKYLTYCWQLIVRCSMMADELGTPIDWPDVLRWRLSTLLSTSGGKRLFQERELGS